MPLNHDLGEDIAGYGGPYRVAPKGKYQNLPRLTITADVIRGRKFKRTVREDVPIFTHAYHYAQQAFANAGAVFPLQMDVLAQEYPLTGQVVFVWHAWVGGQPMYVIAPYQLAPEQIADLKVIGAWDDSIVRLN